MDIKKIVNSLVKKHKTRNPFEIIKGMNVILVPVPLEGVRGFYQYFQRNNIIYIDDSLPEHEQILVCAHELGHMLLHKKANALFMDTYTGFNTTKYEKVADLFAMVKASFDLSSSFSVRSILFLLLIILAVLHLILSDSDKTNSSISILI